MPEARYLSIQLVQDKVQGSNRTINVKPWQPTSLFSRIAYSWSLCASFSFTIFQYHAVLWWAGCPSSARAGFALLLAPPSLFTPCSSIIRVYSLSGYGTLKTFFQSYHRTENGVWRLKIFVTFVYQFRKLQNSHATLLGAPLTVLLYKLVTGSLCMVELRVKLGDRQRRFECSGNGI